MSRAAVILATGRDPRTHPGCSHTTYVRTHARAALAAGYDVHTVCLAPAADSADTDFGRVHAATARVAAIHQNRIPLHAPVLARAIADLVRALGRKDVILHGFGVWGYATARAHGRLGRSGARRALLLGSYTTHLDEMRSQSRGLARSSGLGAYARFGFELAWSRAVVARYEGPAYRRADRVLVNYRSVERLIAARFGAGVRCRLIPYGIEQEFLATPPPEPRPKPCATPAPRILCVARHDPRKGVDVLLHALRRLKDSGIGFSAELAGYPSTMIDTHRRLLRALGLADRVAILGRVESVDDCLAGADIFVLPSRAEQSGSLALIEAMRAGVACVASGCDGIPEDARHGIDAWLTTPGDVQSLAGGLAAVIADAALRETLARGARRRFAERFSAAAMTAALDCAYQDALSEAGAPARVREHADFGADAVSAGE